MFMHLDNGKIVADNPEEELFLAQARLEGMPSESHFPGPYSRGKEHRESLASFLDNGERIDDSAIIRGLSRISISHTNNQARAIEWLTRIAEEAVHAGANSIR
jgi:hypothetical protein